MRILILTLAAACAAASVPAVAQTLKPGLWEMERKGGGDQRRDNPMAEMQKRMATMSPEQRKQMEAAMASHGMAMGRAGGMAMKICLTPDMVKRNEIPSSRGECKTTQKQRTGNTVTLAFTCVDPPSSGETLVTINSPESFASHTTTNADADRSEAASMDTQGKWLAADCGGIKPFQTR